jgi:tetratricopeptide (TPR) repeat protein
MAIQQRRNLKSQLPADLPARLIRGEITLAQVFGLDREALYKIARIGYGLLNSGNLRDAKQIYAGLVAADPYDSVFHCHLGAVHHRLGEYEDAIQQYSLALSFNRANADALTGRGEIHLTRGEVAAAISDLKRAIEIDPTGARASTSRARALLSGLMRAADRNRKATIGEV